MSSSKCGRVRRVGNDERPVGKHEAFKDSPRTKELVRVSHSTSTALLRQELLRTWRRWGTGVSLVETLGGIIGNLYSETQELLNMSGLWEMMWACIILAGPMAAIVINWDWLKSLVCDKWAFQALAPELERIMAHGITYKDVHWIKTELAYFNISCPHVLDYGAADSTALLENDEYGLCNKWNRFFERTFCICQQG